MNWLISRWSGKGGSGYDPWPVFDHHKGHVLEALVYGSIICYPGLLPGILQFWLMLAGVVILLAIELIEYLNDATPSDCFFDFFQHLPGIAYMMTLDTAIVYLTIWAIAYFILLYILVDEDGNAKRF